MKIMIVDDHILFRNGLVSMFRSQPDMKVVAEAGSIQEAITAARKNPPDLILLDLGLPDGNGFIALHTILSQFPKIKICVLTIHEDRDLMLSALRFGAKGFLLKNISIGQLINSIRAMERGEIALSRRMMAYVVDDYSRMSAMDSVSPTNKSLTARELDVLDLLEEGASNRQIAERLVIALNTAKIHVRNVLHKLGLKDRNEAASFVRRYRMKNLPDQTDSMDKRITGNDLPRFPGYAPDSGKLSNK